jgi:hypothetical protein
MKEKLTIEHLAPYLPYKLQVVTDENYGTILEGLYENCAYLNYNGIGSEEYDFDQFKPFLIPLSEFKMNTGYETLSLSVNDMDGMPYTTVLKLISQHYDVFGLIDIGLALNKNNFK